MALAHEPTDAELINFIQQHQEALEIELARQDLGFYGEYVLMTDDGEPMIPARHHQVICNALMDESIKRLLIIAPPGSAKTTWTCLGYGSWYIGNNPEDNVLLCSVTGTQAESRSVAIRDTIESNPKYKTVFPEVIPDKKKGWGERDWFIKRKNAGLPDATLSARGVGGPVIGARADLIIVDDPHDENNSATKGQRDKLKRWFKRTLKSRLRPGGRIVVIMTRWHEDDLAKDLIEQMGFEVVHLPTIMPEHEELTPKTQDIIESLGLMWDKGELLWPEYQTWDFVNEAKRDLGSFLFEGMYQGNPRIHEGNYFKRKWFKYFKETPTHYVLYQNEGPPEQVPKDQVWKFQTLDPASSTKTTADFFVLATWGVTPNNDLLLLDVFRDKLEGPDQIHVLKAQFAKHSPGFIRIEKVAYQLTLFQSAIRAGLPGRADLTQGTDKISKALVAVARYESGKIYHRQGAEWLYDLEEELLGFNNAEHDDQVDNVSMASAELAFKDTKAKEFMFW